VGGRTMQSAFLYVNEDATSYSRKEGPFRASMLPPAY